MAAFRVRLHDEGEGVQVVNDVVGHAAQFHGRGLRDQVRGHLLVKRSVTFRPVIQRAITYLSIREPKDRQPKEDLTRFDTTSHFVHPRIVKGHPGWLVGDVARFGTIPEVRRRKVLVCADWIERPPSTHRQAIHLERLDKDISLRRLLDVVLAQAHHQKRTEDE